MKYGTLLSGCIAVLSFTATLHAQEPTPENIPTVDITQTRTSTIRYGSIANSSLSRDALATNPANITAIVTQSPSVAENGQNGLLQTFSIRGISGQRVQTRIAGVPISTERRAGTGASFFDPWHIQQVDVLRGPASTQFGSGAIGGVVLVSPRFFDGVEAELGYESGASQRAQALGMGNKNWSLALTNRSAADGESAAGDPLHTGFNQSSILLQNRTSIGSLQVNSLFLSSRGRDIGRSNNLYPNQRIGDVTVDDHNMLQINLISDAGWQLQLYGHEQSSESDTLTTGLSRNSITNESVDWGGRWHARWSNQAWSGEYGIDFDVRDKVRASEVDTDFGTSISSPRDNLIANQNALGMFAATSLNLADHRIEFGLRQSWVRQHAQSQRRLKNQNLSAYVAWQWFIDEDWSLSSEFASAYRVPSLTERYYSGSTARGESIGNPQLKAETAPGIDLGVHWNRATTSINAHWYRQEFDNYIQRTAIDADIRSFNNLNHGTITGVELEGRTVLGQAWTLRYGLHWIEGEDSDAMPVADIPGANVNLGIRYEADHWQWSAYWRHRFSKSNVSPIEQVLDAADIVSLEIAYRLSDQSDLSFYLTNALNEVYLISGDEISTLANKRILGIRYNYRFGMSD